MLFHGEKYCINANCLRPIKLGTTSTLKCVIPSDEVRIVNVEVTGFNTRISFTVEKCCREYVPSKLVDRWAFEGDTVYIDFVNSERNEIAKEALQAFTLLAGDR